MASPARQSLEERYAAALFDIVSDPVQRDSAEKNLIQFSDALKASPDLQHLIKSPVHVRDSHISVLTTLAKKMGFTDVVQKFLGTVARNGRANQLPKIIQAFLDLLAHQRGEKTIVVVSARPLTDTQRSALLKSLSVKQENKTIRLEEKIDPSLLGGFVLTLDSTVIDTSLRGQLQRLEQTMKGAA